MTREEWLEAYEAVNRRCKQVQADIMQENGGVLDLSILRDRCDELGLTAELKALRSDPGAVQNIIQFPKRTGW